MVKKFSKKKTYKNKSHRKRTYKRINTKKHKYRKRKKRTILNKKYGGSGDDDNDGFEDALGEGGLIAVDETAAIKKREQAEQERLAAEQAEEERVNLEPKILRTYEIYKNTRKIGNVKTNLVFVGSSDTREASFIYFIKSTFPPNIGAPLPALKEIAGSGPPNGDIEGWSIKLILQGDGTYGGISKLPQVGDDEHIIHMFSPGFKEGTVIKHGIFKGLDGDSYIDPIKICSASERVELREIENREIFDLLTEMAEEGNVRLEEHVHQPQVELEPEPPMLPGNAPMDDSSLRGSDSFHEARNTFSQSLSAVAPPEVYGVDAGLPLMRSQTPIEIEYNEKKNSMIKGGVPTSEEITSAVEEISTGIGDLYTAKKESFGFVLKAGMTIFMQNPDSHIRGALNELREIELDNDILDLTLGDLIEALAVLDYKKSSEIIPLLTDVGRTDNIRANLTKLKPLWPLLIFADYYAKKIQEGGGVDNKKHKKTKKHKKKRNKSRRR